MQAGLDRVTALSHHHQQHPYHSSSPVGEAMKYALPGTSCSRGSWGGAGEDAAAAGLQDKHHGGSATEHGLGGGVGFGQEAEGKQLGGSLHSSGDAVLISTSALRSQLPTSPNTKHQLDGN